MAVGLGPDTADRFPRPGLVVVCLWFAHAAVQSILLLRASKIYASEFGPLPHYMQVLLEVRQVSSVLNFALAGLCILLLLVRRKPSSFYFAAIALWIVQFDFSVLSRMRVPANQMPETQGFLGVFTAILVLLTSYLLFSVWRRELNGLKVLPAIRSALSGSGHKAADAKDKLTQTFE